MMEYSVTPLFPIPLYRTSLGSLDRSIKDIIEELEFERMPSDNGFYTVDKNVLDRQELQSLKNKIQSHINNFLYEVIDCETTIKFEIQNSWINRHSKSDWAPSHRHSNSLISGVYYIDVDETSGDISFIKDKNFFNLWYDNIDIETGVHQEKKNFFNVSTWNVTPKKNDLLMFPSLLYHSVSESRSDRVRHSLAFNVFPRGTIGSKLNRLTI